MVEIEVLADDAYDWDVADDEEPGDSFRGFSEYGASPRRRMRVVSVKEAKRILTREEANKLVDFDAVVDEALERVEESGIVFIDELDKIVGSGPEWGSDISGEGVQRDLLPIVEGSVVMTRYGPVNTQHILFIAAGSFSRHKPSDLIPELQGRFPLRVELRPLSRDDLRAILVQPRNSLLRQYQALLRTEGVELVFTEDGVDAMADIAWHLNQRMENIGARRLQTVVEQVVEEISFNAPNFRGQRVVVDAEYVRRRMRDFLEDEDLSRYIL
jgi:ATP-dependent HslUV protease ATP-binding subunit HslU